MKNGIALSRIIFFQNLIAGSFVVVVSHSLRIAKWVIFIKDYGFFLFINNP